MFTQITMIDYHKPLVARRKSRKHCGPYTWSPTQAPCEGRGFYQSSKDLDFDRHGSTFRLRLELANDHLHNSRLGRISGYYADEFQDTTLTPIIARLPHSRGFLAGWTMGEGMIASLSCHVWENEREAAMAAHDDAERCAEREREFQASQDESEAA